MKVFNLRPFKGFSNVQLLDEVSYILGEMRKNEKDYEGKMIYLNQLIREVKIRNLSLTDKDFYHKILHKNE